MKTDLKTDMARVQALARKAYAEVTALVMLAGGNDENLQRRLEQTAASFESATIAVRRLCEKHCPGVGGYGNRPTAPPVDTAGTVELSGYGWLHIRINTLLPHCRFEPAAYLTDTIRRLLDDYEAQGRRLPYFERALLVIDEWSGVDGRHTFDQDNKGWKAVSNAVKGRLLPDDDQYTMGLALLSTRSDANCCHITLLAQADAGAFFALRDAGEAYGEG